MGFIVLAQDKNGLYHQERPIRYDSDVKATFACHRCLGDDPIIVDMDKIIKIQNRRKGGANGPVRL